MTAVEHAPVRFAMFDRLDESGRGQGETYAQGWRMLELALADHAESHCHHLAEHHATALSTVPSPNLFVPIGSCPADTTRVVAWPGAAKLPTHIRLSPTRNSATLAP